MTFKDSIKISNLNIECIIGILPHERKIRQPVIVDIELCLDLSAAAETGEIQRTIDYALLTEQVRFILETGNFELLETAAMAIISWLTSPVPTAHLFCVESTEVRISKPNALEGSGVPEIRMKRHNRDIKIESIKTGDVTQDVLFRSSRVAVIRVYHFGSTSIPGSPKDFPNYKDFSSGSRDLLRVGWK